MWSAYSPRTTALERVDRWDKECISTAFQSLFLHKPSMAAAYQTAAITSDLWPQVNTSTCSQTIRNQRSDHFYRVQVISKLRRRLLVSPAKIFEENLEKYHEFVKRAAVAIASGGSVIEAFYLERCLPLAVAVAREVFPDLLKVMLSRVFPSLQSKRRSSRNVLCMCDDCRALACSKNRRIYDTPTCGFQRHAQ
jgi:hypothetical protein